MGLENLDENFSLNDEDYINNLLNSLHSGEFESKEFGTINLEGKDNDDK